MRPQDVTDSDGALAGALDALERADFAAAKALLATVRPRRRAESARAELLRARIARIEGEPEVWRAAAAEAARLHPEPAGRLLGLTLEAAALKQLNRDAESAAAFRAAWAAFSTADPRGVGEVAYLLAVDEWERRRYDRAAELVARNVRAGVHLPESEALLGWIDVAKERFSAAAGHFLAALGHLNAAPRDDVRLRARMIHALGVVASETIDLKLGQRVRREFEALEWPATLGIERFNTRTALRFLALLEGDVERAWILSRDAVVLAPNPAYAAIGETNAAVASRLLGDVRAAELQASRAWDILSKVRWSSIDHEGRVALTNFAIECAHVLPAEASKALTKYRSLTAKRNTLLAFEYDRRIVAFEKVASARVAEGLGQRGAAIRSYAAALEIWLELGFAMRAALVALDLYQLTGDEARLAPAQAALERAPAAWFGSWKAPDGPVDRLTPAERVVLFELLRGKTAKDIADTLDRSQHTVINHTRKVFAAFGVSSRARLLARCAELGITAPRSGRRTKSSRPNR
jgi:DNA-binding CsgD family transcriptional regulator